MKRVVVPVILAALSLAATRAHALYATTEKHRFWPDGLVPVCWQPGIDPNGEYPLAIRYQVESTWSFSANVSFSGWGNCEANTIDGMPNRHVVYIEQHFGQVSETGMHGRVFGLPGDGSPPRPTLMKLRFGGSVICDTVPGIGYTDKECAVWTAVHEFGHALGFVHEHDRLDFPGCTVPWDWAWPDTQGGGRELTAYDGKSTMNYCSDGAGTNKGRLTERDIVGLQAIYGKKPAGTFAREGGRVLDVDSITLGNGAFTQFWHSWGGLNQAWKYSPIEGTVRTEAQPDLCLDDEHGNTVRGTQIDVWQCDHRATPRWQFDNVRLYGLGRKCLEFKNGLSVNSTCVLNNVYEYTTNNMFKKKGTNTCLDFAPGAVGSRGRLSTCNATSFTQKFVLQPGGQIVTNGLCLLTVDPGGFSTPPDGSPGDKMFQVNNAAVIRLEECDAGEPLQRQFSLGGVLRGSAGNCVNGTPTSISHDGWRAVVGNCSDSSVAYFEFNFGDVAFTPNVGFHAAASKDVSEATSTRRRRPATARPARSGARP